MAETQAVENAVSNHEKAESITHRSTLYAAGAGLIPFPIVDVATLLGVQVVMVKDIAEVYGHKDSFKKKRVKHFIQILIGDLGAAGILSGAKAIPVVGSIIGMAGAPLYGAASTYALGRVFTQHFELGGTILDFDPEAAKEHFKEEFEKGKEVAKSTKR